MLDGSSLRRGGNAAGFVLTHDYKPCCLDRDIKKNETNRRYYILGSGTKFTEVLLFPDLETFARISSHLKEEVITK